jgi:hypothetical protein
MTILKRVVAAAACTGFFAYGALLCTIAYSGYSMWMLLLGMAALAAFCLSLLIGPLLRDLTVSIRHKLFHLVAVQRVRLKIIGNIVTFLLLFGAAYGFIWFGSEYAGAIESWISTASIAVGTLFAVTAFLHQPWNVKA